jgi:K+-sensing histidine kinase KdpD
MIEGLLDQADRGASVFQLNKQPLSVAEAAAGVQAELADQIGEFGCRFILDADEQLMIDADARAFRQMLLVLLNYALRFVGADTSITVSAGHIGTDTIVEVACLGLINAADDDRDKVELQLVNALALAHGARLTMLDSNRSGRIARLTFFATRAAA